MEEKVYKSMKATGALNITLGIIMVVIGVTAGILMLVSGGKLLSLKSKLMF